ncbi:30S ribosomal protein S19 [archaeon]|jgi:small subunit ribosomal protein S19|nr:30S ribosomal protein S19 [archaeon]
MELRKKELKYKGMSLEELQKLEVREFAKFVDSRRRRSLLRNFQATEDFVTLAKKKIENGKKVRTHIRDIVIVPQLIGMRIAIYNGNEFLPVDVTIEMLGHKFGEFAPTRTRTKHTKSGVGATKGSRAKSKK